MSTTTETYRIAVIGAGGKMGMRVSNNLAKTAHAVAYVENSPAGAQRTIDAGRELTEETGYAAREVVPLAEGPIAVGTSDEIISFFHARGLTRVGPGGGVDAEQITTHTVPLRELQRFLAERRAAGRLVDPKVYAGLFLVGVSAAGAVGATVPR